MNTTSTVERLAVLPTLAHIPREQLQWLVDHGEVKHAEDGAQLRGSAAMSVGLLVVISGRFSVRIDKKGEEREVRDVPTGGISGYLPYSRMTTPRGYLLADGPVEYLAIPPESIREMTRECYEFTASCVHEMLDRARVFKSEDKHQEKMAALGRLSAGLAHELNNPASAVARAAGELEAVREELAASARALGEARLDERATGALQSLQAASRRTPRQPLNPVDRADLEDRIVSWLEGLGLDVSLAYPLVEYGLTVVDLEACASGLDAAELGVVLRYVAADAAARGLTADILSSSARIHSLVAAVKKHTHMDRAPVVEPIVLRDHLSDTVTLMSSKAALKKVTLELNVEDDLPPVVGSVADLNQVWMHLVDNAIDAAEESGRIAIDARKDRLGVLVQVVDDGPGIPAADQERIFEPFFTTKRVGQGRGLGLDIVRTVVQSHGGTVELSSKPGCTEFKVTLPTAESSA